MDIANWHTSVVLGWLQSILEERFGHFFTLTTSNNSGRIALHLHGDTRTITLNLNGSTFTRADSNLPCTAWNPASENWQAVTAPMLPAPGYNKLASPLVEPMPQGYHIQYDILGLTYWMLTRQEEVGRTDLDEHGRFPATASHAYKHGYLERPIVDEWLQILGQVIQRTWPGIELRQHRFSMKVSHDVDEPSRYGFRRLPNLVRAMVGDVIKRRDFKSAILAPWVRMNTRTQLHRADPANTFDWIMDVSEQHGLKGAFYFICGHTHTNDGDYQPEHPAIRHLMRRIHKRGHEIGLHPSYGTYQNPLLVRQEADRLRKICVEEGIVQSDWGGRMHYLRWQHPTTLHAWAEAGMSYDSTLGYADCPGFRCGTCFEYRAFDPVIQKVLNLRIRPLIAMDITVIAKQYLGIDNKEVAKAILLNLLNQCRVFGGVFTLLWHNNQLLKNDDKLIYEEVISCGSK